MLTQSFDKVEDIALCKANSSQQTNNMMEAQFSHRHMIIDLEREMAIHYKDGCDQQSLLDSIAFHLSH